jgi:hypothetical protein
VYQKRSGCGENITVFSINFIDYRYCMRNPEFLTFVALFFAVPGKIIYAESPTILR